MHYEVKYRYIEKQGTRYFSCYYPKELSKKPLSNLQSIFFLILLQRNWSYVDDSIENMPKQFKQFKLEVS